MSKSKRIAVKMLKKWGRRVPGDIVMFDPRKGLPLIEKGFGELVKKVKAKVKVETAMVEPIAETADNPPRSKIPVGASFIPVGEAKAKVKAKAKKKGG